MTASPIKAVVAGHEPAHCFHCGLPVPPGADHHVDIDGRPRPMCCRGCAAVARAIIDAGLGDFYRHRTAPAPTGREVVPAFLREARAYDLPAVQRSFVRTGQGGVREASLVIEGITCAACVWLNERHLATLPGVVDVQINYSTRRARVRWDENRIRLSDILRAVSEIGYLAHPYDPERQHALLARERRDYLRRLAVAGALGMQVMMLAVGLYGGEWFGIEAGYRGLLQWASLGLTLPVVIYAAQPFFRSAANDLRHGRAGMDVPVALGIGIAFAASVWATLRGGHVYYDSVVMFTFFLLTARFFELGARTRAAEATDALARLTPAVATRLTDAPAGEEVVPVAELRPGDRVRIRPGESVPADGVVVDGASGVDESLLTGESLPLSRHAGDPLTGGSVNVDSPLVMEVRRVGGDTVLAAIQRLLERAQSEKPRLARLADRVAPRFVAAVLLLALAVGLYWWWTEPARWLPVTVAVLVVTCPCALSLATPAALTAATGRLARLGLLATRGHALETLARATDFVFDKTGTLTEGRLRLQEVVPLAAIDRDRILARAAALERGSEHPIAAAITDAAARHDPPVASEVRNTPGAGVRGRLEGVTYYLGTPEYVAGASGRRLEPGRLAGVRAGEHTLVVLGSDRGLEGALLLADRLRPDAASAVAALGRAGIRVSLLSGDRPGAARAVAAAAGIEQVRAGLKPQEKLAAVKALQRDGAVVAMVGDGINDAPVLAGAQVSVAMGGGTQVAATSADMVLLSDQLGVLGEGVGVARRGLRIIRQNLAWALLYNLVALPAAAMGWVAPWMAAIGMSASSLVVVGNALRLAKARYEVRGTRGED